MLFAHAKNPAATYGAIIDIGSGSVGVAIVVSNEKNEQPEILFTHREYLRIGKAKKVRRDEQIRKLRETLFAASLVLGTEGAAALVKHNKHAQISKVLVTCSSPWSHTIARSISYDNEERDRITKGLVGDLINSAEDEIANTLEESAIIGKLGLSVVERTTVDVRVNGYSVKDPVGLKGTTIELSHITGLIPEKMLDSIEEIQEKAFTSAHTTVHTYMLVAYCVFRDLFPEAPSLCVIDVTSESTEIGIIEDGVLKESSHAPYGSNTLIRNLTASTKGTHDDAVALLRSYADGTLAPNAVGEIKTCLEEYQKAVGRVFDSLQKGRKIPLTMVITANAQLEQLFVDCIPPIMEERTRSTYTTLDLRTRVFANQKQPSTDDTFLAIGSRFFHKLHGCGDIELE